MSEQVFSGIELLPDGAPPKQLFILLHGVGGRASDLLPLAKQFKAAFPQAAFLLPEGLFPFDGGGSGRQWFSIQGVTDVDRPARVAAAMPALHALVLQAQDRLQILHSDTALVGFSQGAIMGLEFSVAHDGGVGRVIAFSGRFAQLPDQAPELTTLHLLHGERDSVMPAEHAYTGYDRIMELNGDATIDLASSVAHEIHPALVERAIHRLQTCIPLRSWNQALTGG